MKVAGLAAIVASLAIALAGPAQADVDTDFSQELQTYGIYGPRDYNAWLGKITCERLYKGRDADAAASARFVLANLPPRSTQTQAWQFLGAALKTYCPEKLPVLTG